jgi:hypothetical protein
MVRITLASGATSSAAAGLHRFARCPEHVPLRPPAWDQEPSAHRTTVPPSAMSRFQSPTQGCPSHSRFPAHPASASAASSAGTSLPPFIATSHVDATRRTRIASQVTAPPGWVPEPGGRLAPAASASRIDQGSAHTRSATNSVTFLGVIDPLGTTNAFGTSPASSSTSGITAASAIAGCVSSSPSSSAGAIWATLHRGPRLAGALPRGPSAA